MFPSDRRLVQMSTRPIQGELPENPLFITTNSCSQASKHSILKRSGEKLYSESYR
jgi:hypothetical protein